MTERLQDIGDAFDEIMRDMPSDFAYATSDSGSGRPFGEEFLLAPTEVAPSIGEPRADDKYATIIKTHDRSGKEYTDDTKWDEGKGNW